MSFKLAIALMISIGITLGMTIRFFMHEDYINFVYSLLVLVNLFVIGSEITKLLDEQETS